MINNNATLLHQTNDIKNKYQRNQLTLTATNISRQCLQVIFPMFSPTKLIICSNVMAMWQFSNKSYEKSLGLTGNIKQVWYLWVLALIWGKLANFLLKKDYGVGRVFPPNDFPKDSQ